jgi:hypothetical protein
MTRTLSCLLVACLVAPRAAAGQSGAFVVRLGNDTLAIEQYTRTPNRLEGELVVRSPRTVHQIYTAAFGASGALERFELVTHNVSGAPGPAEQQAVLELHGDTAAVTLVRGDSTVARRIALGAGGLPYVPQCWGLVEEVLRRARTAGGERFTTTMLQITADQPWTVDVTRRGADSVIFSLGAIGPLRARVDGRGTMLGLTGVGGTMQVTVERTDRLDFAALGKSFAARSLGALSPADSTRATIGGASVAVRYSRPAMRGRVIFGGVVPWNQVWRTGANAATILETSADLVVGGTTVPPAKYSLWTIPTPSGWTLIINRNTGQWGTDYNAQYDLARLDMKVEPLAQPVERFTIAIAPQGDAGMLKLEWDKTRASIAISRKP